LNFNSFPGTGMINTKEIPFIHWHCCVLTIHCVVCLCYALPCDDRTYSYETFNIQQQCQSWNMNLVLVTCVIWIIRMQQNKWFSFFFVRMTVHLL
jgi:hypothetical protein